VIFHRHRHLASAIYSFAFTSLYFMFFLFMVQNTLQNLRLIDFFLSYMTLKFDLSLAVTTIWLW